MKNFLFLFLLATSFLFGSNPDVKVYYEQIGGGVFGIYADNNELCPVSVAITLKLTNMRSNGGLKKTFVIEPGKSQEKLFELSPIKITQPTSFSYDYSSSYGDSFLTSYDVAFEYYLPFEKGSSFRLSQGYNGALSHQAKNAVDFSMPVGTPIHAARGGLVVKVVEHNDSGCGREECKEFNNEILIYHDDGTLANYVHLEKDGAIVSVGDSVATGQHIGFSGNTGWSTGPHLHFEVYISKAGKNKTLRTKFRTDKGDKARLLREKETYARGYD